MHELDGIGEIYRQNRYPIWAAARLTQTSRIHDLRYTGKLDDCLWSSVEINSETAGRLFVWLNGQYLFARIEASTDSGS